MDVSFLSEETEEMKIRYSKQSKVEVHSDGRVRTVPPCSLLTSSEVPKAGAMFLLSALLTKLSFLCKI